MKFRIVRNKILVLYDDTEYFVIQKYKNFLGYRWWGDKCCWQTVDMIFSMKTVWCPYYFSRLEDAERHIGYFMNGWPKVKLNIVKEI